MSAMTQGLLQTAEEMAFFRRIAGEFAYKFEKPSIYRFVTVRSRSRRGVASRMCLWTTDQERTSHETE